MELQVFFFFFLARQLFLPGTPKPILLEYRTDSGAVKKKSLHESPPPPPLPPLSEVFSAGRIRAADSGFGQNRPKMCVPPPKKKKKKMVPYAHARSGAKNYSRIFLKLCSVARNLCIKPRQTNSEIDRFFTWAYDLLRKAIWNQQ